jgi:hypothetical protein
MGTPQKVAIPFEEWDPCLFNFLKEMDFEPLPAIARIRVVEEFLICSELPRYFLLI